MRTVARRAATALLLAALSAAPARAGDIVELTDGRFVEGVRMTLEDGAVVLHYAHGDVRLPKAHVADYVIEGVAAPEPATEENRAKRAQGLVPWRGKWVKPEVRTKGIEADRGKKLDEIADAKAHSEWRNRYQFQTKGFEYESTYPARLNDEYSIALEQYFDVFRKDWGVKVPKDWGKLIVCLYRDRSQFERTAGGRGGTLAYYQPVPNGGPRTNRTLNCYYDGRDPDLSLHCMFHECSHYMQDLVSEGTFWIPHWVGESMAEYYGSALWEPEKKQLTTGRILEDRLVEVRSDIDAGKRYTLLELIVSGSDGGPYEDYYWGWSFVHFVMNTPAYQKKFQQFFMDLCRSKDVKRDSGGRGGFATVDGQECLRFFKKRMGIEDLEPLQREWYAYIDKLPADTIRGIERAGLVAFRDGYIRFRAPRLLKLAIDKGSTNALVYSRYCICKRIQPGGEAEALAAAERACEVDPLNAYCWAERSYVLNDQGRTDEAKKCLALAQDISPDETFTDMIEHDRKSAQDGGK